MLTPKNDDVRDLFESVDAHAECCDLLAQLSDIYAAGRTGAEVAADVRAKARAALARLRAEV